MDTQSRSVFCARLRASHSNIVTENTRKSVVIRPISPRNLISSSGSRFPKLSKLIRLRQAVTSGWLFSGSAKCWIRPGLLDSLIMPLNQLLYKLDPKCTRKMLHVVLSLAQYLEDFKIFCEQHVTRGNRTKHLGYGVLP